MKRKQRNQPRDLEDLLQGGFRYALSLTHNEAQAEDLVQDACLRMLKTRQPWRSGYFYTTIRNRFIDLYRRSKNFPVSSLDEENGGNIVALRHPEVDSETRNADADQLDKALSHLRTEEREALYLSAIEGYTAKEISQLTQKPRNTILSLIHRARKKLVSLLGNDDVSEVPL